MTCTSLGSSALHFLGVGSREAQSGSPSKHFIVTWEGEEAEPKGLPSLLSMRRSIKDDFFLKPATLVTS